MTRIGKSLLIVIILAALSVSHIAAQAAIELSSPVEGEVLQGVQIIQGSTDIPGFQSSEVDFAYSDDTTGTWFTLATSVQAINQAGIATWDTTTITDGNYSLRLRVYISDGSYQDVFVRDLRVRNYSAIETPTPAPTAVQPTLIPTATETPPPFPTPTDLPSNPAILTPIDVSLSLGYGGLGALGLLVLLGIYLASRRK